MPANNANSPDEKVAMPDVGPEAPADVSRQAVDARRRRLARFGLGAPVLVTLASRPVFAGQCLSNMMSGNLSNPNRGNCSKGWSPGGWGQPGGQVHIYTTDGAWTAAGFVYGTYSSTPRTGCPNPSTSKLECYINGTTFGNAGSGVSALNKNGVATNVPWREIVGIDPSTRQLTRHLVCAFLNAKLSAVPGSTFHYALTPAQVIDLANGAPFPAAYTDLQSFLGSTWN